MSTDPAGTGLTDCEHEALDLAARLWDEICAIANDGAARPGDLRELGAHIHAIQNAVMANAAARAYPERYRLLGGNPPSRTQS